MRGDSSSENPDTKASVSSLLTLNESRGAAIETDEFACVYVQCVPVCVAAVSFLSFSHLGYLHANWQLIFSCQKLIIFSLPALLSMTCSV